MAAAVVLRGDYDAQALRRLARSAGDPGQVRRLLALAAIYAGGSRGEAAEIGGVVLQTVRALRRIVEDGPIPSVHGVVRWRIVDLMQWLWEELRLSVSKQTMSKELRAMGFRKLSARPRHHAKDDAAEAAFKKTSPRIWRRSRRVMPLASR